MYVPAYNPYSVWGPPVAGAYPALPYEGSTFGSLIGSVINLAGLFAGFLAYSDRAVGAGR